MTLPRQSNWKINPANSFNSFLNSFTFFVMLFMIENCSKEVERTVTNIQ